MSLLDRLHEEYESDGGLVLFRCTACGHTSMSLGSIHAHCESHRGWTRFGIQLPFTTTALGDFDRLMELTEVVRVEETREISLDQVEGL